MQDVLNTAMQNNEQFQDALNYLSGLAGGDTDTRAVWSNRGTRRRRQSAIHTDIPSTYLGNSTMPPMTTGPTTTHMQWPSLDDGVNQSSTTGYPATTNYSYPSTDWMTTGYYCK